MKFEIYPDMALTCDLPEHRLRRDDTIAVTAVPATTLEALRDDEVLCARTL
jgi:hypothetical protein